VSGAGSMPGKLARPEGRVLGVDLGERRIGVALGDLATGTAVPLATLGRARSTAADAAVLARLAREQRAEALVVGLPLEMSGAEGPQAALTREWALAVAAASGLAVRFRDERLTSQRAELRLGRAGRGRSGGPPSAAQRESRRRRVDREAAALMLQDELDSLSRPAGTAGPSATGAKEGGGR
jgi:putative Holliday junction resolvase